MTFECAAIESADAVRRAKACAASAKWRAKNPTYSRDWAARNPESRRKTIERHVARNRALPKPDDASLKRCGCCVTDKPRGEFTPSAITKDGRHPICRVCNTGKRYGVSAEEFEALWSKHGGQCAVCFAGLVRGIKNGFAIDHDHESRRVRGLLCNHCNLAIGHFRDNPSLCSAAAAYLTGGVQCGL